MPNTAQPKTEVGKRFRILCLGEILYDIYADSRQLGGAPFNFAFHLDALQQDVAFVSRIGTDENGNAMAATLNQRGFPMTYIQRDTTYPTGRVMVSLDSAGVPSYEIVTDVAYDFITLEQQIEDFLASGPHLIYFGTLAQRSPTARQTLQAILADKPSQALTLYDVNLRQNFFSREILETSFENSDLVKLNDQEFGLIQEMFTLPDEESNAAQELMGRYRLKSLCITKGEQGSALFTGSQTFRLARPSADQTTIVDTVGAGDAFTAMFALGSLFDWPGSETLARASDFATAICGFRGAIPENPDFYDPHLLAHADQN